MKRRPKGLIFVFLPRGEMGMRAGFELQ
jgi:hypothetical protein